MSAPIDYARVAALLKELHGQLLLSTGYTDAVRDAAKLCETWPLVQALLTALAVRPRLPRRLIDAHAERLREALR